MPFPDLSDRLREVRDRVDAAVRRGGHGQAVTIVGVTKTHGPDAVQAAWDAGIQDVGENRVQEALPKMDATSVPVRWHLIGHLQRNKVKPILPLVSVIHSIDSLRLAEEIDQHAAKANKKVPVLMQVNASEESSKFGVAVGASVHLAEQIDSMENVQLIGLMTMAPLEGGDEAARRTFLRTREIFEEMKWHKIGGTGLKHLSMGMSNDFETAIEEGATMIRVGTLLFGGKVADEEMSEE